MLTKILSISEMTEEEIAAKAAEILERGGLVAFPTETVYGLGGNALDAAASKRIYAAKGRPSDNPLIVHIGRKEDLPPIVQEIPEKAQKLIDAFWPGPLTLIFRKSGQVPHETTGGLDTVAVRMPSHPIANAILRSCGVPVAAPSANLSGRPSTTSFRHVKEDLYGRVDAIIDGGDVPIGVESTILDLTGETPMLLRPGYVTKEQLESVIGPVKTDPAIENKNLIDHAIVIDRPKAPGMKYRHYAPKAELTVIGGDPEDVRRYISDHAARETGILTTEENADAYPVGVVVTCGRRSDPESVARSLFDALRTFDETGVTEILAEDLSGADIGTAVMNRLLKAAGGNYKNVSEKGEKKMIAIGCDHGGFELKKEIEKHLEARRIEYVDFGCDSEASTDYPIYAKRVAKAILSGEAEKGILICGTGIGISITANKFRGIRAALCTDCFMAEATRLHNDANILALGGRVVGPGLALKIVDTFLDTPFSNEERHKRRISQIEEE